MMRRYTARCAVNVIIVISVLIAWMWMAFGGNAVLEAGGTENLKFFTVLSNLMEGAASLVWLIMRKRGDGCRAKAERFKYIAAASVFLTFAVVVAFLGPLYGFGMMFENANLFFHLLIPLAAVAEIIFLSDAEYTKRDNNLAVIPPVVYGIVYLGNCIINGTGEWPDTNDWYLFLAWGYPVGILIFAVITAVTWLLALLLRKFRVRTGSHSS